jgi:hypothetical protein
MMWNTFTNSIDALTGNYDPVGHGVGAGANIVGMLPVPGAGAVGTAISVGYSGSTAGDEPSDDKEGGDSGPDGDTPDNADKKDDDTDDDDKKDDDTDDDDKKEQCTEETKDQEEGEDTSDSNSKEGSGTDNPMNDGYDGPPLVLKLGKEEWVPDYDSDGGSTNKASSRNTLGNWEETENSSGYAMPGTRQDYDVITQAGGGHTDPGENDLWSPQSYYIDPVTFEQVAFKANGGGTKGPLLGSYNSAGFDKDDTDPNDPDEPDTGSDGQEGNSGSINPFRGLIGSGPIGAGFIGHASNSGLLAALEGSLTANTEALQSNSSILA